jgi:hypothetical protein
MGQIEMAGIMALVAFTVMAIAAVGGIIWGLAGIIQNIWDR